MAEVPKKRGRGRPKKIIETIPEIEAAEICILDGLDNQFHGGSNIEVSHGEPEVLPEPSPYEEEERVTMAPIPEDFKSIPLAWNYWDFETFDRDGRYGRSEPICSWTIH